jgi:hypothetical protein
MWMPRHSPAALVLGAIVWLLAAGAGVKAEPVLDQEMDPTGRIGVSAGFSGTGVPPTQKRAQTFTVGLEGTLAEVDVFIRRTSAAIGDLMLEIRPTTVTGFPVADPSFLIQTSLPASSIPTTSGFVPFDLTSFNLPVTPGEQLAVVLYSSVGGSGYNWLGTTGDPYPDGSPFEEQPPNHSWINGSGSNGVDFGFRTFVDTGPGGEVPEPTSLTLFGLGAAGVCGCVWRRGKR